MKLLDVNVLVAAHRAEHPHHHEARAAIDGLVRDQASFSVPDMVAVSVVRLCTNRRVVDPPSPTDEVFAFVDALRAQTSHVDVGPNARTWAILKELIRDHQATGELVTDAALAALAKEKAATVVSFDRDFARFADEVAWERPS